MPFFTATQKKVFAGCFATYACAYIARLNMAAALPDITASLSLSGTQAGLFQTVFAAVYAAGQLVNGTLADRISPRRHIFWGLAASALCNLLFGFSRAYWQMVALWALNGAAQSMLWTPIVKLMAGWYDERQRPRVSFWISITLIAGHFLAWAISGFLAQLLGWRLSFLAPGCIMVLAAAASLALLSDPGKPLITAARGDRNIPAMPVQKMIFKTGLWLLLIACAANGFVRDGVLNWAPSILGEMRGQGLSSTMISLVIPPLNLLGLLLGRWLFYKSAGHTRRIIGVMLAGGAAVSVALTVLGQGGVLAVALLLGLCCSLMSGVNPLFTVILPMEYVPAGRVGLAAGILDSSIYLGSALGGVLTGALRGTGGMRAVFLTWAIAAALGACGALLSTRGTSNLQR